MGSALLDAALDYAGRGWPVFPCHPCGATDEAGEALDKRPLGALAGNGVLDATTDTETIRRWWEAEPKANIGFHPGAANMVAIDIDPGAARDWSASLNLEDTHLAANTPRGGVHLFYALDQGEIVSPSASKIAEHVDVRSFNSYVLLAPSKTQVGEYQWTEQGKPAYRSDEFMRRANSYREKDPKRNEWLIEPDLPENVQAAVKWLENDAKVAVEGQGGDTTTYATAAHLRSFGISEALALELMADHWNMACEPAWTYEELQQKVTNGYSYATSPPGNITRAYRVAQRKVAFSASNAPKVDLQSDGSETHTFGRYTIRNRAAINHIPAPSWLLKGLIPEQAYCVMYAPETSFKTFLALDMALSVACGFPQDPANFSDAEILQPGPVLYITGEGLSNIRKRVAGWEQVHNGGREVSSFDLFNPAPRLTDDLENLTEFIKSVRNDYKLIVVDTVARVMQGMNENGQENASAFTRLADWLRAASPVCSVLALHHVNKNGSMRGSGVFSADADVVLRVEDRQTISESRYATELTTIKMKDGPDQTEPLKYHLKEISIGESTTLVPVRVTEAANAPKENAIPRQSANTKAVEARQAARKATLRRADHAARRSMIETATLGVLDGTAGKSWAVNGLATAVAHGLENISKSNARDHINEMKTDETSALHARYDPVTNRFK